MDMTFFTFICCKNCIVCLKRPKINKKEAGVGPIFLKNEKLQIVPISATQSLKLQKYNLYLQIICQIAKWMPSHKSIVKGEMMHRNKSVLVYSNTKLIYSNTSCYSWNTVDILSPRLIKQSFFSLSGVLKGDTLAYVPGNCDSFKTRNSCLSSRVGVKCVWNTKKDSCEIHPPNRAKSGIETCLSKKQSEMRLNYTEMCAGMDSCSSCTSSR